MGAGKQLWGWYPTTKVWIPLLVDANGKVVVDMSAISLGDLGDVSVAAPADHDIIDWDAATSKWVKRSLGDMGAHHTRHEVGGADPIPATFLPDIVRQSNFIFIPTVAGWVETTVGAGAVYQEPTRQFVIILDVNAGSALASTTAYGFGIGGDYQKVNWDKHTFIIFNYGIYKSEANLIRRIQFKQTFALGILAEMGLGIDVTDLVITGESYGTARGTVSLGNMVFVATNIYASIQVVIELDPDTPAVNFYINGSLVDSITNANHIPSGIGAWACYFNHSIYRAAGGVINPASIFLQGKMWQEF